MLFGPLYACLMRIPFIHDFGQTYPLLSSGFGRVYQHTEQFELDTLVTTHNSLSCFPSGFSQALTDVANERRERVTRAVQEVRACRRVCACAQAICLSLCASYSICLSLCTSYRVVLTSTDAICLCGLCCAGAGCLRRRPKSSKVWVLKCQQVFPRVHRVGTIPRADFQDCALGPISGCRVTCRGFSAAVIREAPAGRQPVEIAHAGTRTPASAVHAA